MELPRDKYVYLEDLIEIIITLCNGQTRVIIAKGDAGIYGVHLSTFYLYSEEEMDRFDLEDLKNKPYCFAMPESDMNAEVLFGMLVIKKGNEIVFMERRDNIKNIIVGSDDVWIDLHNEHKSYFMNKFGLK